MFVSLFSIVHPMAVEVKHLSCTPVDNAKCIMDNGQLWYLLTQMISFVGADAYIRPKRVDEGIDPYEKV